jgi:hypothetical protein
MLCGHKPFADLMKKGTSELGIQQVIREIEPTRPSDRVSRKADDSMTPEISDARRISPPELERKLRNELEWIPLKAMRKDRDRRYASPLEMAEDIENYLADRPLRAGPESRAYRLRKYLVRNRLGVLSAAAVILLLVAGVSFYIHNIRAEQQKTSAALAEVTRQKAEAERETAKADAVVGFQTDMLSQADPEHAKGDRVTVVEAMAAAIKKLDDGALNDEPIAEQKVRMTAATTLLALGQYAEAERQARLSVALARRCLPAGDLQIGFAIEQLANVLRDSTR